MLRTGLRLHSSDAADHALAADAVGGDDCWDVAIGCRELLLRLLLMLPAPERFRIRTHAVYDMLHIALLWRTLQLGGRLALALMRPSHLRSGVLRRPQDQLPARALRMKIVTNLAVPESHVGVQLTTKAPVGQELK